MGEGIGPQALHDSQLIGMPGKLRQGVGDPQARLAMLAEGPLRTEERLLLERAAADLELDLLPITLLELGLVVEQVHLRRTAIHVEKNAGLGPLAVGRLWRERPAVGRAGGRREKTILLEEAREGKA